MKRISGRTGLLGCSVLAGLVCLTAIAAGQSGRSATKYPPQFPREGATKLFENDHVIVWEQVGRPKEAFVHKHIHDILTFGIEGGKIEVINPDGAPRESATKTIYSHGVNSLTYSTAGLGPHAELATDPDHVPRSIFVELKGTEPKDCRSWSTACQ